MNGYASWSFRKSILSILQSPLVGPKKPSKRGLTFCAYRSGVLVSGVGACRDGAEGEEMSDLIRRLPGSLWTPADDEILRSMVLDRMHTREIALHMKRTSSEIPSRLNILLRPERPQKQMG
jgi:hypothetical protein